MKREIKFRAYNKTNNYMHQNVGVHPSLCEDLSGDDEYYETHEDGRYIIGLSFDNYAVMQYIGIKDKNGKEVYDEDVLNLHRFYQFSGDESEREQVGFISIEPLGVYFNDIKNNENSAFLAYMDFHEESLDVIGNIHENPELLNL